MLYCIIMTVYYIIEYLNSENPEKLAENRFEI